ncbi:hypothetical protein VCHE48_0511 [Vibrio cholerae HE48]|uniref:DUF2913 family protein n=1 Tax=Vibrio cholerae TaxID=666 RepID=UPI000218F992|nr:DUF2913 family protein [Vibrio cholerae]EGR09678.1 hypothetical protein VCHE48_0511 [Vibrio cholerae HE48]EGR4137045.1 DUF2913 family protein [Vibrio cholerae]EII7298900.1 DUF2913 family protein [Vibrio cholerae]MEB5558815.1 DUF2913 family protein [Vibrio cholerae]GHZ25350.1 hypothetical protein VCSRO123_3341 [Vibrio cholerae]
MSEPSYHKLLKATFENALLHLYFKVSASQRFIKEEQRNKILIDFLKPKLREQRYSLIKKKLKTICLMKNKFGSIEKHLNGIVQQYNRSIKGKNDNDVDKLYDLLEQFEKAGFETKLIEETPTQNQDVVYLDRAHINNCFDEIDNHQIAPISLLIHTEQLDKFTQCLDEQIHFKYEIFQVNESLKNYHYRLHPLS